MNRLGLMLCATALLASPARALDCDNALSQHDMNQCAHLDWQAADAELNAQYKRTRADMRNLDAGLPDTLKGAGDALRDAQRAWIAFRDKACAAEGYLFRGGSMEPLIVSACMAELTRRRIGDLRALSEVD